MEAVCLFEKQHPWLYRRTFLGLSMKRRIPSTRIKGRFKPYVCKVFALQDGVPFEKPYRSITAAKKVQSRPGITHYQLITLN